MEALIQLATAFTKLNEGDLFSEIVSDKTLQTFILDLNRLEQLFEKGIDSEGRPLSSIGGGYSPVTEELNRGQSFTYKGSTRTKKAGESPFLFDTGDFYESFTFKVGKGFFEIDANPNKDDTDLFVEWGEDILGLTDESKEILRGIIIERIVPAIRANL